MAISDILVTCVLGGAAILVTWLIRNRQELHKQHNTYKLTLFATYQVLRIKLKHMYTRSKSNYYWFHRNNFPRIIRWVADGVLNVDSTNALVDNPVQPSDAVRIKSVIMRTEEFNAEVEPFLSEKLRELDEPGATDKIMFTASDVVSSKHKYFDKPCIIEVRYRGHSNPGKKIPAKDYFVRYDLGTGQVAQFPPYGTREMQQKGFGVRKIKSAVAESCNNLDVTAQAQVCAGPRRNFYTDCEDSAVVKNYINVKQPTVVTYTGSAREGSKILLHPCGANLNE